MQSGIRAAKPRSFSVAKREARATSIQLETDQTRPLANPAGQAALVTLLALRQRVQT